jgi:hypothetical protein
MHNPETGVAIRLRRGGCARPRITVVVLPTFYSDEQPANIAAVTAVPGLRREVRSSLGWFGDDVGQGARLPAKGPR